MKPRFDEDALKRELIRDEGKRLTPYQDSRNYWTVGVGHLLVGQELLEFVEIGAGRPRKTLSEDECAAFLAADIQEAESRLTQLFPAWRSLDDVRQRALLNLTFNLGMKLGRFVGFLRYIEDEQWKEAVAELKNSRWWQQVGHRGPRIAYMIQTGKPYVDKIRAAGGLS